MISHYSRHILLLVDRGVSFVRCCRLVASESRIVKRRTHAACSAVRECPESVDLLAEPYLAGLAVFASRHEQGHQALGILQA